MLRGKMAQLGWPEDSLAEIRGYTSPAHSINLHKCWSNKRSLSVLSWLRCPVMGLWWATWKCSSFTDMYNICCYGEYFFTNVLFFFIIVRKFMWYKKNTTHYDIIIILNLSIHGCNKSQHPISDYFSIAACHIMLFIITVMIIHIWYHFSVEISFLINFLPNLLRKGFF